MEVGTFGYGGVNPNDGNYDVNDLPAGQRISLDGITETIATAKNLPVLGGEGTHPRSWHVECVGSWDTRLVQTATEVYGVGTTRGRTFTRMKHDTWYPWQEVYTSGNMASSHITVASLVATGNVTAYSDIKLKEDIEVIPDAITKINALHGYTYKRKDIEDGSRHTGVIAQEVQKVLPEAVMEDEDGTLSVAYGNMAGLLIEAIKELKREINDMSETITYLTEAASRDARDATTETEALEKW